MSVKIAIIINTSWNIYNFRRGLVKSFLNEGHDVIAITPNDAYVSKLADWGVRHLPIQLEGSGLNPLKDLKYLRQLKIILRAEQPDIVLSYTIKCNIYGSLATKSLRIPIICNVSGLGTTFLWKGWIRRAAITLYNRAFKSTDFTFFQNQDDRNLFLDQVQISPSKTGLLPGSGIDLSHFKGEPPPFARSITLLMISRLIIEKGVLEYLAAAKELVGIHENVKFWLVGKYEPNHKRCISEKDFEQIESGKWIEYLGEKEDVKETITAADLVVLPSYREGTPRTLLEAAAMSRPLIATDVPGCKEVVSDGANGFLCDAQNTASLVKKIELFLALNPEEKQAMAKASRTLVEERFDERIVIAEYSRKIKQLLS